MKFSELLVGDVIFCRGGNAGVSVPQKLLMRGGVGRHGRMTRAGDPEIWHSGIVCFSDGVSVRGHVYPATKVAIAHAVAPHWERTELRGNALPQHLFPYGTELSVFRFRGPSINSIRVGQLANRWVTFGKSPADYTQYADGVRDLSAVGSYGMKKAVSLVFRSSRFGAKAVNQVQHYQQSTNEPPASIRRPGEHRTMFCSMFTVAAWQAVLGVEGARQYMEKDAMATSPMALQGYFMSTPDNWENLGVLERDW